MLSVITRWLHNFRLLLSHILCCEVIGHVWRRPVAAGLQVDWTDRLYRSPAGQRRKRAVKNWTAPFVIFIGDWGGKIGPDGVCSIDLKSFFSAKHAYSRGKTSKLIKQSPAQALATHSEVSADLGFGSRDSSFIEGRQEGLGDDNTDGDGK